MAGRDTGQYCALTPMLCDTILAHECEEQVSVKIGDDIGRLQAGLTDYQLDHRYAVSMRMLGL